jgi:DNA-binding SARP family transcriptional activator
MQPTIRIQVLGPVQAWRADREVPLGPPQQRSLLAHLVVAGGRPTPTGTLIDELWPESPPRSAVNIVQTYIKRLRRLLEPERPARAACSLLPSVGGGYALRLEPDSVDLWRFRALMNTAREAVRDGDHGLAASLLTQALELWNGPPASNAPTAGSRPRWQAVAEERWTAVNLLGTTALRTGQSGDALPAVEEGARLRPLDEAIQASLVRLLHSLGRRSDAIQVYHRARTRLREEFGINPGLELSEAFRAVLRDDAESLLSAPSPPREVGALVGSGY